VTTVELELLCKKERLSLRDVSFTCRNCKVVTLVVPTFDGDQLRIKLVDDLTGIDGEKLSFGGKEYVFGYEGRDLSVERGVLVSCWKRSEIARKHEVSFEELGCWMNCYGRGYGQRTEAKSLGMNVYLDARGSSRPHPSPFVADKEIPDMQYYNANFKFPLIRGCLMKCIKLMNNSALMVSREIHPQLMTITGNS